MTLGERIAQLRKNKNMTQEDLAEEFISIKTNYFKLGK